MLDVPDEKEKKETEYRVFFKFVYFFMHMTMRSAFSQLTEQQITKLQGNLDDLLADAFFADRSEDLKERIIGEFLAESNDAELEYSTCKELISEKSPDRQFSLF